MNYELRRARLLARLDRPTLLFAGGLRSRNYPANAYPFRADSSFLYFFERPEPGSAALFDPADASVTLYLPERTLDDALWHGEVESFATAKQRHRVAEVLDVEHLEAHVAKRAAGRQVGTLAVADSKATARARAITGEDIRFDEPLQLGRWELLQVLAELRLVKDDDEIAAMRRTAVITRAAHLVAMRQSRPGVTEGWLAGEVEGTFARGGCVPAYGTILSVRGEILHSRDHANVLKPGDIVLLDGGAEEATGYCSDVTRCWPVGGGFSPEGRDVYGVVLMAQLAAIAAARPGARFKDLHLLAARVMADGLVSMGLLRGSADGLVEQGAHALFFPHGLGHQIGLDVHDLEAFGDRVHYPNGRQRSPQFGTQFLRMDMDLAEGMTFTIEPGLYFVPAIIRNVELRARFKDVVNFDRAEHFLSLNGGDGFGGIRIEDDVRCTATGAEVLTGEIPKALAEIEALVGTA